jgi:hypothetical protein
MSARKKALTEATAAEIAAPVVLINIDKGKQRMTVFDSLDQIDSGETLWTRSVLSVVSA